MDITELQYIQSEMQVIVSQKLKNKSKTYYWVPSKPDTINVRPCNLNTYIIGNSLIIKTFKPKKWASIITINKNFRAKKNTNAT